jgi:hypothetical protein
MLREHERVVLTDDLLEHGLKVGDVGTVVHVHAGGKAFEVEFVTLNGETAAVVTLESSRVRSVYKQEITHARSLAVA